MNDTDRNRLCRLLHSYELGLLEGDQLDEFEQHIMDCPDCRKQAEEFLPAARLLKDDPEIRGLVEGLQRPEAEARRGRIWPALVAVAAVALVLILRPWNLEFRPSDEAIAVENRLAILFISGPSDSEETITLGQTAASLLIADLSESRFLRVVSSQRLYDAARNIGLPDPGHIDQDHAAAVAHSVGAKWMLAASMIGEGPGRAIVTQLYDVATGDVEASQRVDVDSTTSVFALVDKLSVQLKGDLGLPSRALEEPDPKVADLTSHSMEAYKLYLKGIELRQRMYLDESARCFLKAIELDSSFAMAYYYLSMYGYPQYIEKAAVLSSHAPMRDQMLISARAAEVKRDTAATVAILTKMAEDYPDEKDVFYRLGQFHYTQRDFGRAAFCLEKSLALDPLYRVAINLLAYCYDELGQFDRALETLDEYARIAPDEPNPLDSRADILARRGFLKEALKWYEEAVKKEPDFSASYVKLYYTSLADGQYDYAESIRKGWEDNCEKYSCANPYWAKSQALCLRGQYREGLRWIDRAIDADREFMEKSGSGLADQLMTAKVSILLGMDSTGLLEAEQAIKMLQMRNPNDLVSDRITLVRALVHDGLIDSAGRVVEQLRKDTEATRQSKYSYWIARSYLERGLGNPLAAVDVLDSAVATVSPRMHYQPRRLQGEAYLEAGQPAKAVEVLAGLVMSFGEVRIRDCHGSPRLYYYLARAYDETEQADSAVANYEKFLGIWENPDPDLKEYVDARDRLARLKTNP